MPLYKLKAAEQQVYDYLLSQPTAGKPVAEAYKNWRWAETKPDLNRILFRAGQLSSKTTWNQTETKEAKELLKMYPAVVSWLKVEEKE